MDKSAKTGVTPFWVVLGSEKLNLSSQSDGMTSYLAPTSSTFSVSKHAVSAWEYIPLSFCG